MDTEIYDLNWSFALKIKQDEKKIRKNEKKRARCVKLLSKPNTNLV